MESKKGDRRQDELVEDRKQEIMRILPGEIRQKVQSLSIDWEGLQEIRLRVGKPIILRYRQKEYFLARRGGMVHEARQAVCVGREQLKESMEYMSNYSRYAYEQEIKQGFLTIRGGHRVGLAGRIIQDQQHIKGMQYISCLNIRLAHEVIGCADRIFPYLQGGDSIHNTLILSPPCGGKTTLLRDIIRILSSGITEGVRGEHFEGVTVGVVDERSEIGSCYHGVPQNDLGCRTDILDGCPKVEGMILLVRSMAPQVIAVDEIGSMEDVDAMEYAANSGVKLLATVHGASMDEIKRKPGIERLIKHRFFERYVLLGDGIGNVKAIFDDRGSTIM